MLMRKKMFAHMRKINFYFKMRFFPRKMSNKYL